MSLEQEISGLTKATNQLTETVDGQIGSINQAKDNAIQALENWKVNVVNGDVLDISRVRGWQGKIDLRHLSYDKFYPLIFRGGGPYDNSITNFSISRAYSLNAKNRDELAGCVLHFMDTMFTWSGNTEFRQIKLCQQTYKRTVGLVGVVGYYSVCVYIRGGYQYSLRTNPQPPGLVIVENEEEFYANTDSAYKLAPLTEAQIEAHENKISMSTVTNKMITVNLINTGV